MTEIYYDFDEKISSRLPLDISNGCLINSEKGISLIINNQTIGPKHINLHLYFDNTNPDHTTWNELVEKTNRLFQNLYHSGTGKFLVDVTMTNQPHHASVLAVDGDSNYDDNNKSIKFSNLSRNYIEFAHEIIHATIHGRGCNCEEDHDYSSLEGRYSDETDNYSGMEGFLTIFSEGAPGYHLDVKTLLQMCDFSKSDIELSGIKFKQFSIPENMDFYTDTLIELELLKEKGAKAIKKIENDSKPKNAGPILESLTNNERKFVNNVISSIAPLITGKIKSKNEEKILKAIFSHLNKFTDSKHDPIGYLQDFVRPFFRKKFTAEYNYINQLTNTDISLNNQNGHDDKIKLKKFVSYHLGKVSRRIRKNWKKFSM